MAYAAWSVVFGEQPSAAKWNILGMNDSSFNDGTGIADSAILPKHLFTGAGSSWPWQSWTPIWTNFTLGNAVQIANYIQIGKTVFFKLKFTFGSTSSMGTNALFTLPVPASSFYSSGGEPYGKCVLNISGTYYLGYIFDDSGGTGKAQVIFQAVSGAYSSATGTGSTTPGTWANGNVFSCKGFYEAA